MDMVKLRCPMCRRVFEISTSELEKKYKFGFVPLFCNYKCELRFSNRH